MSHDLLEKARKQRCSALVHTRIRSAVVEEDSDFNMKNVFAIPEWTTAGNNVVSFRKRHRNQAAVLAGSDKVH